jgi:hypothetical protein
MVKCPACGKEIKYIPVGYTQSAAGVVMAETGYTEVITDSGRVVKGHLRHKCPDKMYLHGVTDDDLHAIGYSDEDIKEIRRVD